jgi:hypothetical protein
MWLIHLFDAATYLCFVLREFVCLRVFPVRLLSVTARMHRVLASTVSLYFAILSGITALQHCARALRTAPQ